jgi:8-amino-7-oxononanoate synthase
MDDVLKPVAPGVLGCVLDCVGRAPRAPLALPKRPRRPDAVTFETHPLYRGMKAHRAFAEVAGLQSPYYRAHDIMAGAQSKIDGRDVVNFASYDYLSLNGHPEVLEAADAATRAFGTSVSASRMTAGERSVHLDLERAVASLYQAEDAIAFVSGHAGAVSAIGTLFGPKDLIVHDALIHNCVYVGAALSGAARRSFPHNDLEALEAILEAERDRFERVLIVTEGLFSMDGDMPDLARLVALKETYSAILMVDEAHSIGVLGAGGRGVFEEQGVDPRSVDLWFGTLSKALVSCGGYVAGSIAAIDLLKHHAPGFVYSVGMPPAAAAAALAALRIMLREPARVQKLRANSQFFHTCARAAGLTVGSSVGAGVIPVMVGDPVRTLEVAEFLLARGVNAFPVLPPGVPEGSSRLRFFISAGHVAEQIEMAVAITVAGLEASSAVPRTPRGGRPASR